MSDGLPPSGTIFDGGLTIDGQVAPEERKNGDHMSVFWPDQGHYSWNNPGQEKQCL